jgi:hypothetical protein
MNPVNKPLSTADLARAGDEPDRLPDNRPGDPHAPEPVRSDGHASLLPEKDATDLRRQWTDIQGGFVDEPRKAVERADTLVADVMKRLAEGFTSERTGLEKQWDRGDNVTTEDLRVALQRYRSFFDRLLAA